MSSSTSSSTPSDRSPARVDTDASDPHVVATRAWVMKAVIGLNLCPFAKSVEVSGRVRYRVSAATTVDALLADLGDELNLLARTDADEIDTTLLIHPHVLGDFLDYNDFLDVADAALDALGLADLLQVASFHPQYQFAETEADDIGNYTNRSPYPTLHLLRHTSVDRAVKAFPDAAAIFDNNIATLNRLGLAGWQRLMREDDSAA